jgi:hypothetical protein
MEFQITMKSFTNLIIKGNMLKVACGTARFRGRQFQNTDMFM